MLTKGMQKHEIEKELENKGDFVKIDHLTRFLKDYKKDMSTDTLKFVYSKLGEIYENKSMFTEAAKMYDSVAIFTVKFSEKIRFYVKEAELYVKAGYFDLADQAIKKSYTEATASEKAEINFSIKEFYKRQAGVYEKELRRGNAVRVYEKLLEMNISDQERAEIKKKLLGLYQQLGKVRELRELERK